MSILTETAMGEKAMHENNELNWTINELSAIQESCDHLRTGFNYTPEMIPVFEVGASDDSLIYCVEADLFKKLCDSQCCTIQDGLEKMREHLHYSVPSFEGPEQMAIAFPKENMYDIKNTVTQDPNKYEARCESVVHRLDIMNCILDEGYRIVFF